MTPGAIVAAAVAHRCGTTQPRGPRSPGGAVILAIAGATCVLALPATPSFLTFWLPDRCADRRRHGRDHDRHLVRRRALGGGRSASPPRSASTRPRGFLGGALGVAALAALIGPELASFKHVYLFCTIATFGVAVLGRRL